MRWAPRQHDSLSSKVIHPNHPEIREDESERGGGWGREERRERVRGEGVSEDRS